MPQRNPRARTQRSVRVRRPSVALKRRTARFFGRRIDISAKRIAKEMEVFYLSIKPLAEAWHKEAEPGRKEELKNQVRGAIKARRTISQRSIESALLIFERRIAQAAYKLSGNMTQENFAEVTRQILGLVKKRFSITDGRELKQRAIDVITKIMAHTKAIEGRSSEGVKAFFRKHPAEMEFFMISIDAFSGVENLYHTNITSYLEAIKGELTG